MNDMLYDCVTVFGILLKKLMWPFSKPPLPHSELMLWRRFHLQPQRTSPGWHQATGSAAVPPTHSQTDPSPPWSSHRWRQWTVPSCYHMFALQRNIQWRHCLVWYMCTSGTITQNEYKFYIKLAMDVVITVDTHIVTSLTTNTANLPRQNDASEEQVLHVDLQTNCHAHQAKHGDA